MKYKILLILFLAISFLSIRVQAVVPDVISENIIDFCSPSSGVNNALGLAFNPNFKQMIFCHMTKRDMFANYIPDISKYKINVGKLKISTTLMEEGYLTFYFKLVCSPSSGGKIKVVQGSTEYNFEMNTICDSQELPDGTEYKLLSGSWMRIITNVIVEKDELIWLNLIGDLYDPSDPTGCPGGFRRTRRLNGERLGTRYCTDPAESPGWRVVDFTTITPPKTIHSYLYTLFYQGQNRFANGREIKPIVNLMWSDTDAGGFQETGTSPDMWWYYSGYYDFNDPGMLVAMTPLESSEPPAVPTCKAAQITMTATPHTVGQLESISFNAVKATYPNVLEFLGLTFEAGAVSNCNNVTVNSQTCIAIGNKTDYTWTADYRIYNADNTASRDCTKTSTFHIQSKPGYLATKGGDSYWGNGFTMQTFTNYLNNKCSTNKTNCLSDYLYSANVIIPNGYSLNNFNKAQYIDSNESYLDFQKLSDSINKRAEGLVEIIDANDTNVPFGSASRQVVNFAGDLTIPSNTTCATASIYLVSGNLSIAPDFLINNYTSELSKNFGCLFIVQGTLTITEGSFKGANQYDIVQAFIVLTNSNSGTINIPQDSDLLRIVGGIVGKSEVLDSVNRSAFADIGIIGGIPTITNVLPAEEIVYEGGRYIYLFSDLFIDLNTIYNIREL